MKHDTRLANDLIIRSLIAKVAKLEARLEELAAQITTPKPKKTRPKRRRIRVLVTTPEQVRIATPLLEAAARINGTTVAEMCGPRGDKRACLGRAEAAHDCCAAGIPLIITARILGNRDRKTISDLINGHKRRMGIQ